MKKGEANMARKRKKTAAGARKASRAPARRRTARRTANGMTGEMRRHMGRMPMMGMGEWVTGSGR